MLKKKSVNKKNKKNFNKHQMWIPCTFASLIALMLQNHIEEHVIHYSLKKLHVHILLSSTI